MISSARKQTTSEEADLYTDGPNEPMKETRVPEILPPRAPLMKVIDGKGRTVNDSPQSVRAAGGSTEFQLAERHAPTLDEFNRAARETPIFVLHLHDHFDVRTAMDAADGFQSYLDDYAAIQELRKRHESRPRGLLWASFICFGIAALFLVALIRELL